LPERVPEWLPDDDEPEFEPDDDVLDVLDVVDELDDFDEPPDDPPDEPLWACATAARLVAMTRAMRDFCMVGLR
jgi:hypothetical protein